MLDPGYSEEERRAIYRAIGERRDVRSGFVDRALPKDVLERLLASAHRAPSVGFMQPSRFLVVRDPAIRRAVHDIFELARAEAAQQYRGARRELYDSLKLEGILEAPQNLCVVCDADSRRGHGLGRASMPETAMYSTVCAIQNLWLAARSEGVGVGWVSILDPARLRALLRIPERYVLIAYLCLGYVSHFAAEPELEQLGWEKRATLESVVSYDRFSETEEP